jgi:regulator of sigma E protease
VEGEPAEEVLQPGDVVLTVNGRSVYDLDSLANIVQQGKGSPVTISIKRDGVVNTYTITPQFLPNENRYVIGAYFLSTTYTNKVINVDSSSILGRAGLEVGDLIVAIGSEQVVTGVGIVEKISSILPSDLLLLTIDRGGQKHTLEVVTAGYDASSVIGGVQFESTGVVVKRPGFFSGIVLGAQQFAGYIKMIAMGLRDIITGRIAASEALAGPVGIANLLGESFRQGASVFLQIFSYLSLSLGLFNLIPFPALDGSRAAFALYELVRGKPLPPEREGMIHFVGFIILIALMLLITYQDIVNLFR